MLNENVVNLLKNSMWDLATMDSPMWCPLPSRM